MGDGDGLTNPHVQETLLAEAIGAGNVGFLVWDETRRYVAANAAACRLLGGTLEQIVGATVGERTRDGDDVVASALREVRSTGRITAERFDGSGPVELEFVTFPTRAAGLPYMASLIWPAAGT